MWNDILPCGAFSLYVNETLYSPPSNTGKILLYFCKYQPSTSSILYLLCPLVHWVVFVQQYKFSISSYWGNVG